MKQILNKWLGRYFGNEEAVLLAVMLASFMILIATVGEFLGPVFAALVIAFLLQAWYGLGSAIEKILDGDEKILTFCKICIKNGHILMYC